MGESSLPREDTLLLRGNPEEIYVGVAIDEAIRVLWRKIRLHAAQKKVNSEHCILKP